MSVIPKKQQTEEDIKLNYITPAILAKWRGHITMETKITAGKINLRGNVTTRDKAKKADYILYINTNNPIAVVEAKDNKHSISHGLQQAKDYAKMLDVKFAYSSNGDGFYEHDFLTGEERELGMDEFPSPEELISRYKKHANDGAGLNDEEMKLIYEPYFSDQKTYPPRYYQRIAINRTISAIARGKQKILLAMATGTGKTYTAFQIVWRLLKSGTKHRVLYLADRNVLVDQSIQQDFAPLGGTVYKVDVSSANPTTVGSYEVYFSLYQQLVGNNGQEHYKKLFKKDFFDLVIVDECHRGSAKADSCWRQILAYFDGATQIGMTATPKETKYVSNINYFGKPIYTYSLKQGIDDGFLAPFKVFNITTNIGEGWRPSPGQCDINGKLIEDRLYTNSDYDYNIIIEDRINAVAREITNYLKITDRMAKTIVFCPREDAAERMRIALNNLNKDMVQKNPDYVVRITGSDDYGKSKLSYFIAPNTDYPVIATTSQLLSTGVDCKTVKLIVLDKMLNSMTEFKQIIGRGTRIREDKGKMSFVVMDFRGVSRMFADPDWDGPIKQDEKYPTKPGKPKPFPPKVPPLGPKPPLGPSEPIIIIDPDGCTVHIVNKLVSIYDVSGKLLRQESITDYTKTNIIGEYATLDNFIRKWTTLKKKIAIAKALREKGIDLEAMKAEQRMEDVDDFDFICHIAYDAKPLTRQERANNVKKRDFLHKYSGVAKEVLEALITKYMNEGVYEIEDTAVLKLDPFDQWGKPSKIIKAFGGKEGYLKAVSELAKEIYEVG